jgi:hypothetical protein
MDSKEIIVRENGSSGKMYNEKFVRNNYTSVYDDVMEYSSLELSDLPFKEKVYHYVNNLPDKVYCSNPNCNNLTTFKNSTLGYNKYCSIKCISSDPKVKETKERKSFEKFGTKAPAMNNDIKNKMILTNNKKYGYNSPMQNKDIQEKSKDTLIKNYGVDNPSKSEEIKIKRIESFKKGNYKENYLKTMLDRYGVKYPYQIPEILKKSKDTLYKNFSVINPYENLSILNKAKEKRRKTWITNKISNNDNIIDIDYENSEYIMKCDAGKDHIFRISFDLYKSRKQFSIYMCNECFPQNFNQTSMYEQDFLNFIRSVYKETILDKTKNIIKPFELDVFLPDLNIGFEFNGIYWHNEIYKEQNYHFNKTELCEKNNIRLIHVYEDDWIHRNDIVKSRILSIINSSTIKIYARHTKIKEIEDNNLVRDFLNKNHIQGLIGSQFKFGLFFNDELVSLMTFGKQRKNMGINSSPDSYELLRFCSKLNTTVIGGASRLFKYFINKKNPKEIISYADRSWSQGELYKKLNFCFIHKTRPSYYYVVGGIRKNRFNFRKDVLIKDGFDSNKTEHEIMLERKIYRIYDSGQLKFIWKQE